MLEQINFSENDVYGFEAIGKVTSEDYQNTFSPLLQKVRSEGTKIRFLFYLGPQFEGFTPGGSWEDFKLGFHHLRTFDRIAVVSDIGWAKSTSQVIGSLMPCPVKVYKNSELDEAKAWLNSGEIGLDHHLDEEKGVLKVEIKGPLNSENFEILTDTVDRWVEKENQLKGLVVHTKKFPGWEDLGSLLSHVTFIKDHHRKIRKVALCANGKIAEFGPQIAKHFVEAKIEHFDYNDIDQALDWAAQP